MNGEEFYRKYRGYLVISIYDKEVKGIVCGHYNDFPVIALNGNFEGWHPTRREREDFHLDRRSINGYWSCAISQLTIKDKPFKFGR